MNRAVGSSIAVITVKRSSLGLYTISTGPDRLGTGPLVLTLSMTPLTMPLSVEPPYLPRSVTGHTLPGSYTEQCSGLCHFRRPCNPFHLQVREIAGWGISQRLDLFFWGWPLRTNTFHPEDLKKLLQEVEDTKVLFSQPDGKEETVTNMVLCQALRHAACSSPAGLQGEIIIGF